MRTPSFVRHLAKIRSSVVEFHHDGSLCLLRTARENQEKHFERTRRSPTIAESTTRVTFVAAPSSSIALCQLRLPSLVLRVQTQGEKYLCQGK